MEFTTDLICVYCFLENGKEVSSINGRCDHCNGTDWMSKKELEELVEVDRAWDYSRGRL